MISCSPQYSDILTMTKGARIGKIFKKDGKVVVYYQYRYKGGKITSDNLKLVIERDDSSYPLMYITDKIGERFDGTEVVLERNYLLFLPKNYKFQEK